VIAIVSYGVGNVRAFARIYERNGFEVAVTDSPAVLERATHLVLPGVGAFDTAMEKLQSSGLRQVLDELVLVKRRPVLGICVGMQMMAKRSDEGELPGLSWIDADVRRLDPHAGALALPHMGWNEIEPADDPLFDDMPPHAAFYFLHSVSVAPDKPSAAIARTDYGQTFVCAVRHGRIAGVQFHPEKSHHWGERLLLNFARS
jgi:glutamine amidotransferase